VTFFRLVDRQLSYKVLIKVENRKFNKRNEGEFLSKKERNMKKRKVVIGLESYFLF